MLDYLNKSMKQVLFIIPISQRRELRHRKEKQSAQEHTTELGFKLRLSKSRTCTHCAARQGDRVRGVVLEWPILLGTSGNTQAKVVFFQNSDR